MSQVLYRKYRPQKFSEVVGQDTIKTILQNALRLSRISHAYLFTGPRGVGKTTIARILAKAVNCLDGPSIAEAGEPCTKCQNCMLVQEGRFLDLIEIDAASYTGVDNMRDIIDHVRFSPTSGKYKVFIIDEVHMLSKAAFNALLKTLEEPPAHAMFILATTEIHKVPATIISRSQRFDFKRVSLADILEVFEKVMADTDLKISPEAQKLVAQAAEGSFRDALSILGQILSFSAGAEITAHAVEEILGITRVSALQNFLDLLIVGDTAGAVKFVQSLASEGKDPAQFTKSFLEYLRLVMLAKIDSALTDAGFAAEEAARLKSQAAAVSGSRLLELVKNMLEAYRGAKTSPVPELPLLIAVMSMKSENNPLNPPYIKGEEKRGEERVQAPSLNIRDQPDQSVVLVGDRGELSSPPPIININLGIIVDRWADVLNKVKEYNHSLLSSLRLGRLLRLEDEHLVIVFPYNFHKDTIDARKNRLVVEQVLEEVFGRKLKVKLLLEREVAEDKGKSQDDLLSEAVKILGKM